VVGGAWSSLGGARGARQLVIGAMSAGVLAQGLYVVLFTNHNTRRSWYYVPGTILATLHLCVAADAASGRSAFDRNPVTACVVIALLTTGGVARG
jgi:hypothetical protein